MENKINILANTLEQMLADCEDNGRDGIQPMLTPDDVALILKALRCLDSQEKSCRADAIAERKADTEAYACLPLDKIDPRSRKLLPFMQRELADTAAGMTSPDYKERFRAEYIQTKIRYERLKAFNTKIEAANRTECERPEVKKAPMPPHDCPNDLLREQQEVMGHYLHILEIRAVIEGVYLGGC